MPMAREVNSSAKQPVFRVIRLKNTWPTEIFERKAGTAHFVAADCIHKIIELIGVPYYNENGNEQLDYNCWTIAVPGQGSGVWKHWKFEQDGIYYKDFKDRKFKKL